MIVNRVRDRTIVWAMTLCEICGNVSVDDTEKRTMDEKQISLAADIAAAGGHQSASVN